MTHKPQTPDLTITRLQIVVIGTPRVKNGMFTGPRYDLSADEFAEQKA